MHLLFIDESRKNDYFCLLGLIVDSKSIRNVINSINLLFRSKYNLFRFNLKNFRSQKKPFDNISQSQRKETSKSIYSILERENCKIVTCIIKDKGNIKNSLKDGLFFLLERFFYFLEEKDSFGIVFADQPFDQTSSFKKELLKIVRRKSYNGISFHERIYQNIFFTNDEFDIFIQLSDILAHNISSYLYHSLKHIPFQTLYKKFDFRFNLSKNESFSYLIPLFIKSKSNRINGYGIKYWA